MSAVASHARSSLRGLLRALFEEAWRRRRNRHRVVAVLLLGTCLAAGLVGARAHRRGADPAARPAVIARLALAAAPGIGVACPRAPNSIACDRVGIAVSLPTRHADLRATIAGRSVRLRNRSTGACPHSGPCSGFYTAYMRHAGLLDGALRVHPDAGRYHWYGGHPVSADLRLTATYPDGTRAQTTRRVPLAPGWG
ncbi:MAG: hypothetical protein QOE11_3240 [Solirubrobacteraceae bacterium]|nr:hypothetical protein [Solirubrobacteraceae bacterium]